MEVVPVLVALALAGCMGGSDDAPVSGATSTPDPADVADNATANLTSLPAPTVLYGGSCVLDAAVFVVPASQIAQGLPPGFAPAQLIGDAPSNVGQAAIVVGSCGNETYNATDLGATLTVMKFVIVTPPPEMADDTNITLNFFGTLGAPDDVRAGIFRSWGVGDAATVTVTPTETAAHRTITYAGTIGGLTFSATAHAVSNTGGLAAVLAGSPEEEATYRFFSAPDGVVRGFADITFGASTEWFGSATSTLTGGQGAFDHPALSGLAIYRHGMDMVRIRYVPLPAP